MFSNKKIIWLITIFTTGIFLGSGFSYMYKQVDKPVEILDTLASSTKTSQEEIVASSSLEIKKSNPQSILPIIPKNLIDYSVKKIHLRDLVIDAEIVSTPLAQMQGLSGRSSIDEHKGMLFVFNQDGNYSFWMKDMLFSIDMIWLDSDGVIVHIEHNISPDTYPESFSSPMPAKMVLEIQAGIAKKSQLKIGDQLSFE